MKGSFRQKFRRYLKVAILWQTGATVTLTLLDGSGDLALMAGLLPSAALAHQALLKVEEALKRLAQLEVVGRSFDHTASPGVYSQHAMLKTKAAKICTMTSWFRYQDLDHGSRLHQLIMVHVSRAARRVSRKRMAEQSRRCSSKQRYFRTRNPAALTSL